MEATNQVFEIPELVGTSMQLFDNRQLRRPNLVAERVIDFSALTGHPEAVSMLKYTTASQGRLVQVVHFTGEGGSEHRTHFFLDDVHDNDSPSLVAVARVLGMTPVALWDVITRHAQK